MLAQEGLRLRKMATSDEGNGSSCGRQGRRMIGLQDQVMFRTSGHFDERPFFLRVCTPQHEDDGLILRSQLADQVIGQALPAPTRMAGSLTRGYGQDSIEQQDATLGPGLQAAMVRQGQAEVTLKLFADVAQTGWYRHTMGHRKGQSMGLAWPVIGVLPQDHDTDIGQWGGMQSGKNLVRVDLTSGLDTLNQGLALLGDSERLGPRTPACWHNVKLVAQPLGRTGRSKQHGSIASGKEFRQGHAGIRGAHERLPHQEGVDVGRAHALHISPAQDARFGHQQAV